MVPKSANDLILNMTLSWLKNNYSIYRVFSILGAFTCGHHGWFVCPTVSDSQTNKTAKCADRVCPYLMQIWPYIESKAGNSQICLRGLPFSMYAILHAIWTQPPPFCMFYSMEMYRKLDLTPPPPLGQCFTLFPVGGVVW